MWPKSPTGRIYAFIGAVVVGVLALMIYAGGLK